MDGDVEANTRELVRAEATDGKETIRGADDETADDATDETADADDMTDETADADEATETTTEHPT